LSLFPLELQNIFPQIPVCPAFYSVLALVITIITLSGCVEHHYYHEHHEHSERFYHHHHHQRAAIDAEIHHS